MISLRYEPQFDAVDGRWRVWDRRCGDFVRNDKGTIRRFFALEAADRFVAALSRGVRRPVGTRA